jgi:hypothetical protein
MPVRVNKRGLTRLQNQLPVVFASMADTAGELTKDLIREDLRSGRASAGQPRLSEFTKRERLKWGRPAGPPLHRTGLMGDSIEWTITVGTPGVNRVVFGLGKHGDETKPFGGSVLHHGPVDVRGLVAEHGYSSRPISPKQSFWLKKRALELGLPSRPKAPRQVRQPARPWFKPGQIRHHIRIVRNLVFFLSRFL